MTSNQRQPATPSDVLLWLEDELRETKMQVLHLEQGLSEAQGQLSELTLQVRTGADATSGVSARLVEIPQITNQVGQIRQSLAGVEEHAISVDRRLTEGLRQQQVETERLRQELNGTHRRIELIERAIDTWGPRFEHLEEADRRFQESLTLTRQRGEELERRHESAELRTSRGFEAMRRYEYDAGRFESAIEALEKQEAVMAERLQALAEAVRRVEQQNDATAAEIIAQQQFFEAIDLLRAEIHRLEDRAAVAETMADGHSQDLVEHRRLLSLLEGKDRGFSERLSLLQAELATYKGQVTEQFHRVHLALDREKRRLIEELERELRELKVTTFRPLDEISPE